MLAVKESKFGNVKKPITGLRDSTKFEELAYPDEPFAYKSRLQISLTMGRRVVNPTGYRFWLRRANDMQRADSINLALST